MTQTEKTVSTINVGPGLKRSFIILWLIQLLAELHSSYLFLWPTSHSCAKPTNSDPHAYQLTDVKGAQIDIDAVQTNLIDAAPESPFTAARAASMGINYDDIAHCFAYPIDYSNKTLGPIVNREGLEPCQNGLLFSNMGHNLSVVSHFQLACSRQWLKTLLHLCLGAGLLFGILLSCWWPQNAKSDQSTDQENQRTNGKIPKGWLKNHAASLFAVVLLFYCSYQLKLSLSGADADHYAYLLASVLFRSSIISSSLTRIHIKWAIPNGLAASDFSFWLQLKENHSYFKIFSILMVIFQALYWPLALRVIQDWFQLNDWLTRSSSLLVSITALVELIRFNQIGRDKAFFNAVWREIRHLLIKITSCNFSSRPNQTIEINCDPDDYTNNADDNNDIDNDVYERGELSIRLNKLIEPGDVGSPRPPVNRVCEFCLMNEQAIQVHDKMTNWMNHTYHENHRNKSLWLAKGELQQNSNNNNNNGSTNGGMLDESSGSPASTTTACMLDFDAYQPTTVPLGEDELNSSLQGPLVPPIASKAPSARQHSPPSLLKTGSVRAHAQVQHDFGAFYRALLDRPVFVQIWLLNFCVCFNYFLFQMLPDHRLIHSKPMSVERLPANAREQIPLYSDGGFTFDISVTNNSNITKYHVLSDPANLDIQAPFNGSSTNLSPEPTHSIYRSLDYAAQSIQSMAVSVNPIEVFWTTALLNAWPLGIVVLLLHASCLSGFETTYFKLKRLLTLVKFSAQLFIAEWLAIGK